LFILRLLNNGLSTADVIHRRTKFEDDYEWRVGKNLEGGGRGIFLGAIPAFVWRD